MASAPASADTLVQQNWSVSGSPLTVNVSTGPATGNFSAGGFRGLYNGSPLLSYCIELVQTFSFGTTYNNYTRVAAANAPNTGQMGQPKADAIARMFGANGANFYSSLNNATQAAGMQLAIWEVVYDTGYNLTLGAFQATASAAVLTAANTYLGLAGGNGPLAQLAALSSVFGSTTTGAQDFITVVPVPPSAALLATGLLFGLWTARRRRDVA